jgi:hypothetical protein
MKTLRAILIVAALIYASTDAYAQACFGTPMTSRNYVGYYQRESWTGHDRQTPVYGGRYAHAFGASKRVIASFSGAVGGMKADTSAFHLAGMISTGGHVSENMSVCAGTGFDAQATDFPGESKHSSDGFGSIPMSVGLGYDLHMGAVTLTPFVAPTLAYYIFEAEDYKNGARQRGFDGYVTTGATAQFSRFSVGANWRKGDRSAGEGSRLSLSTGVAF